MIRYLPVMLLPLLGACSSAPETPPPVPQVPATTVQTLVAPHPGLHGQLLGVANGADVDLALLAVDLRGRPQQLLGQVRLRGDGEPLSFHLPFASDMPTAGQRIELRGRVSQAGRLVQRLPARTIANLNDQDLGQLQLVPAP